MRRRFLALATSLATALAVLALNGCGSSDDAWSGPHADPKPSGVLGAGFYNPMDPPAPESTITPDPDSWAQVHAPRDYRVVLLTYGDDEQTQTLVDAVHGWADDAGIHLKTVVPEDVHDLVPGITRAMDLDPDLIISAGNDLVDPLALVTATHLSQDFLVVGAELAEPTANVTAVDWTGASFRGEGLGMSSTWDPATFTPERSARAVRAGVAAVLNGVTGIVVWID